ncbi:hypothetical protein SCB29_35510, partial [Paraburkholderia sp. SIMBA_055]
VVAPIYSVPPSASVLVAISDIADSPLSLTEVTLIVNLVSGVRPSVLYSGLVTFLSKRLSAPL